MSAVIASMNDQDEQIRPWYRHGWLWFLISFPLVSVMLGSVMLYLAFNANNSLVVDDYYKEGKAYNLRIERDRLASLLGVNASVRQTSDGVVLELSQSVPSELPQSLQMQAADAQAAFVLHDELRVRWVHVTQSERDGFMSMMHIGGARYIAQGVILPQTGKFRLHIEPVVPRGVIDVPTNKDEAIEALPDSWRLISDLASFSESVPIAIAAPALDKVFTRTQLQ